MERGPAGRQGARMREKERWLQKEVCRKGGCGRDCWEDKKVRTEERRREERKKEKREEVFLKRGRGQHCRGREEFF